MSDRNRTIRALAWALAIAGFAFSLAGGCGERAERGGLGALLPDPDAVPGVEGMGEIARYEGETLYDFLNGGAEIYFDYGILAIASAEYIAAAGKGIEVSIYDMGSDAGAFGIYSNVRYAGAEFVDIGNEGMLSVSSLDFWKGRYYCRLVTFDMETATQSAMRELGAALAEGIAPAGSVPAIVGYLPEEGRIARSEKLFRGVISLNNIRYISGDNVFNLGPGTRGAAAGYEIEGTEFGLFLIEYESEVAAVTALESFRSSYPEESGIHVRQGGHYLAGVWDLEGGAAGELLESLLHGLANGARGSQAEQGR